MGSTFGCIGSKVGHQLVSSAIVTSVKSAKGLPVSQLGTPKPIDWNPGTSGSLVKVCTKLNQVDLNI